MKSVRDHTFMTSMKNAQFLHSSSLLFLSIRMGPNRARPRLRWTSKQATNQPHKSHPLWYSYSLLIIFSRCFHQIPCPCNSQLFLTKNQFKFNLIFCDKPKRTCLSGNAKNKTKMLSKAQLKTYLSETRIAEPDTSLQHL